MSHTTYPMPHAPNHMSHTCTCIHTFAKSHIPMTSHQYIKEAGSSHHGGLRMLLQGRHFWTIPLTKDFLHRQLWSICVTIIPCQGIRALCRKREIIECVNQNDTSLLLYQKVGIFSNIKTWIYGSFLGTRAVLQLHTYCACTCTLHISLHRFAHEAPPPSHCYGY